MAELVSFAIRVHSRVCKTDFLRSIITITAGCLVFKLLYPQFIYDLLKDADLFVQFIFLLWFIVYVYPWSCLDNLLTD